MQIDDFSLHIAKVHIYMRLLGYKWDSPRVVQFLERVESRSRHHLSFGAYKRLGEALEGIWKDELNQAQKAARTYAITQGVQLDEVA